MSRTPRLPTWMVGSGIIAVSMGVMNVTTYGFTLAAARLLGPAEYGVLAALMGLMLVLNVVSLGLQATAARRVAAAPEAVRRTETEIVWASYRAAIALGLLTLAASPALTVLLRFDSWWEGVLLAVGTMPLTIMGAQAGVLQGERRWLSLAGIYLAVGVGRLGFGLVGVLWRSDAVGAMAGVAVGNLVPALIGWWLLRHPSRTDDLEPGPAAPEASGRSRSVIGEVMHNSHALLAFFALANADVVAARITLSEQQAGLYAGGIILAKAVLFLPQFVVVLSFPSMASRAAEGLHVRALALVAALGACAVVGVLVLPGLAVLFVGGGEYDELRGHIWAFAVLGTLLAIIQMLVYEVVARQHRRAVFAIWLALGTLVLATPFVDSVGQLVATVAAVDVALLAVLVAVGSRGASPDALSPSPEPEVPLRADQ